MIGIFIGSFNPPTLAHLEIALKLKNDFQKIVFVPVNTKEKHLTSFSNRLNMLRIYKMKYNILEIDDIMKNYSYLNYRIIDILKKKYGNIGLIIGSDLLNNLDTFDNLSYLLSNYHFTVITRFGIDTKRLIKEKYFKYQDKFNILEYNSNISSSMVRNYLKENKDTSNILDKDIYLYIKNKKIYF